MPIVYGIGNLLNKIIVKYSMFKQLITICFLCITSYTSAQHWYNDGQLHPGVIIAKSKTLYRGNVLYDQANEKLTCYTKNGLIEFDAEDVYYFQFYDNDKKLNRFFYAKTDTENRTRLYELLLSGAINVYRKSVLSNEDVRSHTNSTIFYLGQWVDYVLFYEHDTAVKKLKKFESDILPLMKANINEISNFIISNELDITDYNDQLLLIDYYNQLVIN